MPKVGDTLNIGDATLTFLAPNSKEYDDLNSYSIVCKLKYGNTSFLFNGDTEDISEGEMLQKQLDIQANVLKFGEKMPMLYTQVLQQKIYLLLPLQASRIHTHYRK